MTTIGLCDFYTDNYKGFCLLCLITHEETSCFGDTGKCECEPLRQRELKALAADRQMDADREGGNI